MGKFRYFRNPFDLLKRLVIKADWNLQINNNILGHVSNAQIDQYAFGMINAVSTKG
jgi:hypothetical protein